MSDNNSRIAMNEKRSSRLLRCNSFEKSLSMFSMRSTLSFTGSFGSEASSSRGLWICGACSYHNADSRNTSCSICGLERDESSCRAPAIPELSYIKSEESAWTNASNDFKGLIADPNEESFPSLLSSSYGSQDSFTQERLVTSYKSHAPSFVDHASPNLKDGEWQCSACTFVNESGRHLSCSMCGHNPKAESINGHDDSSQRDQGLQHLRQDTFKELIALQHEAFNELNKENERKQSTEQSSSRISQESTPDEIPSDILSERMKEIVAYQEELFIELKNEQEQKQVGAFHEHSPTISSKKNPEQTSSDLNVRTSTGPGAFQRKNSTIQEWNAKLEQRSAGLRQRQTREHAISLKISRSSGSPRLVNQKTIEQ